MAIIRIGHGYDVHATGAGDGITLGGVDIECGFSLCAHSDGDVVFHALTDALLGAAALGDIGTHFPDTDETWRGADSRDLLTSVMQKVEAQGWRLVNVDITLIARAPQIAPHVAAMRETIAERVDLSVGAVNVKATTHEGLDALGRGEGIAAHAVCLIEGGG